MSTPVGSSQWMYSTPSGFYPYSIDQSLRFNDNDSAYLSRTPASAGNRKTWTFNCWFKLTVSGTTINFFGAGTGVYNNRFDVYLITPSTDARLGWILDPRLSGGTYYQDVSLARFRDPSAWYMLTVKFDTTQATAADRIKLYINGEVVSVSNTNGYPAQNTDWFVNNTNQHFIGNTQHNQVTNFFDGYMAEVNFIDGQALDPTSFGETINGIWVPKAYSGSYGTNGFYLSFADSAAIGDDLSGNTNDWTANNLAASDVVSDSPTNNFPVLNPLDQNTGTLSEGNLKVATVSTSSTPNTRATFAVNSGKWYWEYRTLDTQVYHFIGIVRADIYGGIGSDYITATPQGNIYADGSIVQSGLTTWSSSGSVLGISLDADAETVQFYLNGSSYGTAVSYSSFMSGATVSGWFIDGASSIVCTGVANFGQDSTFAGNTTAGGNADGNGYGDFKYAVPSGFLSLNSANLPEPAIGPNSDTTSDEHFNTVLYTGTGATQSITGVGFQPDWTWVKRRSGIQEPSVTDSVRGVNAQLRPASTAVESAQTDALTSFDADGFTLGADATNRSYNYYTDAHVAWNWKAGGTAVSNTDGSITSSVSANTDAGFAVGTYTGNATAGATIGHSLGATPEMVIVKRRSNARDWAVYHKDQSATPTNAYLLLNSTATVATGNTAWNNGTFTSSVFTIGSHELVNFSGDSYVFYAFRGIDGHSKCGSYVGNGSTDGTFVYTGFRPAWVMHKTVDTTANHWSIRDNKRDPDNEVLLALYANLANADDTGGDAIAIDFLSNGFKARRTNSQLNQSGTKYIYLAFAEAPFKYANAR